MGVCMFKDAVDLFFSFFCGFYSFLELLYIFSMYGCVDVSCMGFGIRVKLDLLIKPVGK